MATEVIQAPPQLDHALLLPHDGTRIFPIEVPHNRYGIALKTDRVVEPVDLWPEQKLASVYILGITLGKSNLCLDPWTTREEVATTSKGQVSKSNARLSLEKLTSLGVVLNAPNRGFRLNVPPNEFGEMLTTTSDVVELHPQEGLWDRPDLLSPQQKNILTSILAWIQNNRRFITPQDEEKVFGNSLLTRGHIQEVLKYIINRNSPVISMIKGGRPNRIYYVSNEEIAAKLLDDQNAEFVVDPILIEPSEKSTISFVNVERAPVYTQTIFTKAPVTVQTKDGSERLTRWENKGISLYASGVQIALKGHRDPMISANEMVEYSTGEFSPTAFRAILEKLAVLGLVEGTQGHGFRPRVPLEALCAILEGIDNHNLPVPRDDVWDDRLLLKPHQIRFLQAVLPHFSDGQLIVKDAMADIVDKLGYHDMQVRKVLHELSQGPYSPFVRRKHQKLMMYFIRPSQKDVIQEALNEAEKKYRVVAFPKIGPSQESTVSFRVKKRPEPVSQTPWDTLGYPKTTGSVGSIDRIDNILQLMQSPLTRKTIYHQRSHEENGAVYVGKFPNMDEEAGITALSDIGIAGPDVLAQLTNKFLSSEEDSLLYVALESLQQSDPENPLLMKIKRKIIQYALDRIVLAREVKMATISDAIDLLAQRREDLLKAQDAQSVSVVVFADKPEEYPETINPDEKLQIAMHNAFQNELDSGSHTITNYSVMLTGISLTSLKNYHNSLLRINQSELTPEFLKVLMNHGLATQNEFNPDIAEIRFSIGGAAITATYFTESVQQELQTQFKTVGEQVAALIRTARKITIKEIARVQKTQDKSHLPYLQTVLRGLFSA